MRDRLVNGCILRVLKNIFAHKRVWYIWGGRHKSYLNQLAAKGLDSGKMAAAYLSIVLITYDLAG
jgi:hypothetical protein